MDSISGNTPDPSAPKENYGPLTASLQEEIAAALQTADWPPLQPTIDEVVNGTLFAAEVAPCGIASIEVDLRRCAWGDSAAPEQIILVGDSVALGYAGALRDMAIESDGQIRVVSLSMGSCTFADDLIERQALSPNCAARKKYAVDYINMNRPDTVIVANLYQESRVVGVQKYMGPRDYADSVRRIIDKFRGGTDHVALLASPAGDADITDCYSKRSNTPADCIGGVNKAWMDIATAEQDLAETVNGVWIDSRPWFCSKGLCPSFVGNTPAKYDRPHMAPAYGHKIQAIMREAFQRAGIL